MGDNGYFKLDLFAIKRIVNKIIYEFIDDNNLKKSQKELFGDYLMPKDFDVYIIKLHNANSKHEVAAIKKEMRNFLDKNIKL